LKKNAPNAKKYGPNGEISPNLVTLVLGITKAGLPDGIYEY
jgi:hypothetical protein